MADQATASRRLQQTLSQILPQDASTAAKAALVTTENRRGVAVLTIRNPPVNALSENVSSELAIAIAKANVDPAVRAIVITGAGGSFIAGADISSFQRLQQGQETVENFRAFLMKSHEMLFSLEDGPKPSVAAIEGVALGGGLEVAMGCSARICSPKSSLGLVELKLGIIPGLAGTQRLPRIVGVRKSVQMMLQSEQINGAKAREVGLVDEVVEQGTDLLERAVDMALELAGGKRPRVRWIHHTERLESRPEAMQILQAARKEAAMKSPNVPHPVACIDVIQAGLEQGGYVGIQKELDAFLQLCQSDTAKGLIHMFFATRACSKVPGISDVPYKARTVRKAAVIGGGLMGSGIATALVMAGIEVVLKEVNQQFLDAGVGRIRANLTSRLKQGRLTQPAFDTMMQRVHPQLDYAGFETLDIVIEAVIEDVPLKQKIFADLESVCSPTCLLTTNTSTIDISIVGAQTKAQNRILGLHFFSPAHVMPLVEIVRTPLTSSMAVADALALCKAIGKTAIVVQNCVGFLVNRAFYPYQTAAAFLACNGLDPYRVDKVMLAFGMAMGPFRLGDLVGLDVSLYTGAIISNAYPRLAYPSGVVEKLVQLKRLGEKTGAGYYKHVNRKAMPDPEIYNILADVRRAMGSNHELVLLEEEIPQMMLFPVINEACRILDEGIVVRSSDIDIASVLGYSFPAYRGGVMKYGDLIGNHVVFEKLRTWYSRFNVELFKPCDYLARCALAAAPLTSLEPAPSRDVGAPTDICVVAAYRTAITKAKRGGFKDTTMDEMLIPVLKKVLSTVPNLNPAEVGDVCIGTVLPKSDVGAVQVRVAAMIAGLPETVPVRTVNRLCSSGLQAIADIAAAIQSGQYEVGIGGGAESMSLNSMTFDSLKMNPEATGTIRDCYLSMGITSENVARRYGVSRVTQDAFSALSHVKAAEAIRSGKFKAEIVPVKTVLVDANTKESKPFIVEVDDGVRGETTPESLAKLKPVFKKDGTTTAGNSSQVSDGAAAALIMTRCKAERLGAPIMGVLRSFQVVGVEPGVMGIGPAFAIPAAVARAGLNLGDIDLFEINEAFASQATYCVDKLKIDPRRVNVNGGAIALGHPLGCTGAKLTATLLHEMARRRSRYGVVSMCIGTGMGAAAVYERTASP